MGLWKKKKPNALRNYLQHPVTQNGARYTSAVAHPNNYAKLPKKGRVGQLFRKVLTGGGINYSKLRNSIAGPTRYSPHARRVVQMGPSVPKSLLVQRPSLKRTQMNQLAMNFKKNFPLGRTLSGRAVMPDPKLAIQSSDLTGGKGFRHGARSVMIGGARRFTPNRRTSSMGRVNYGALPNSSSAKTEARPYAQLRQQARAQGLPEYFVAAINRKPTDFGLPAPVNRAAAQAAAAWPRSPSLRSYAWGMRTPQAAAAAAREVMKVSTSIRNNSSRNGTPRPGTPSLPALLRRGRS
jgi:hypothetical protein